MTTQTEVLYNARCPVCRAEIEHYQGYAEARGLPIAFHDLNSDDLASWGIDADAAAKRLHVRTDGRVSPVSRRSSRCGGRCRATRGWRASWRCRGCGRWPV